MGRGVPKAGFRMTKRKQLLMSQGLWSPEMAAVRAVPNTVVPFPVHTPVARVVQPVIQQTDEEILANIEERFDVLREVLEQALDGDIRSVIISGPAGVGKSHMLEAMLKDRDPDGETYDVSKGYVLATGLYKLLWKHRDGGIVVFDDADKILFDPVSLNLLKGACDSGGNRTVAWLSQAEFFDDNGDPIDKKFEFNGTVIFISNLDFDGEISRGSKLGPHLQALISRSMYIDLAMHNQRACFLHIKNMVLNKNILGEKDLEVVNDVVAFIEKNLSSLRELSLRTALKVHKVRKNRNPRWEAISKITCCKQ